MPHDPSKIGDAGKAPPLSRYNAKRNFAITSEPAGKAARRRATGERLAFVIQKHWASHLHYDFRLELDGVMLSWAVPKGPSCDPTVKRMAIQVEDHPISYNRFEGSIPKGQYGAGTVIIWDRGTWTPVGDPREGLVNGKLVFQLHGEKLAGLWELVRTAKPGEKKQDPWLLFKKRGDAWARPAAEYDVLQALPDSVVEKPLGPIEAREAGEAPDLSQAVKAPFPRTFEPQLATLAATVPAAGDWVIESKFDGYRMLVRVLGGQVRLFTRNGHDWTARLQPLADELAQLGIGQAWLDGEIVAMNDHGIPDFNRLQNAIDNARTQGVAIFLFDVPFLGDTDLRGVPLRSRRAVLQGLLKANTSARVRFSEALPSIPSDVLAAACRLGLEGVMLKRAEAPYVSRRSDTWLKLKCQCRQEFVVIGFTDRANATEEIGALLLGYHDEGQLRAAGSVGTGWSATERRALYQRLAGLQTDKPTVDPASVAPGRWSRRGQGREHWVKPRVVVEVAFGEWTPDGHIRHASFRGVRTDKPAKSIGREQAKR